jgi:hypothetical protein
LTKAITHLDQLYDRETVIRITDLRHERWALYAILSLQPVRQEGTVFTQQQVLRCEQRLRIVNAELYELTKNEIYNV